VFEVGDYVYLKVTPMKKKRFGVWRKLPLDLWDHTRYWKEGVQ
jgi:hypothetical protein